MRLEDLPFKAQQQALRKLAEQNARKGISVEKPGKYHNERDVRGTLHFASRKEARRYDELAALLAAGQIRDLKLQPQFTLQEAYTTTKGERVRAIRYQADFSYERPTAPDCTGTVHWLRVVEDVKSRPTRTRVYLMKRKLLQEKFKIDITEV